ncbi:MAG: dephospho-CoA kinase [Candidatus Gastranaerophilales bacterium]|nr:dephospho-CoA kinase [Candidatus Gastranaerophilales bacterium]
MKIIGLTGNIASGKSTVEKIISDNGYKVIDADFICHELLDNNKDIIDKVKKLFQKFNILDENNNLDRKKIGEIVFKYNEYKTELENILHPFVKQEINKFIEQNNNENVVFVSVPLLFEAHMEDMFDKIVLICAKEELRFERLIKRNNYTPEHAIQRINSQISEDLKVLLSDFVIDNNGSLNDLRTNTENVLSLINK